MLLPVQNAKTMHNRKNAALSSLKFFTDIKQIRSSNIPGELSVKDTNIIQAYRNNNPSSVIRSFSDATTTGVGNCKELIAIIYSSLYSNPRLYHNSDVMMCRINNDYGVVIVTNKFIARNLGSFKISDLSLETMIVDAWTRDWYFPNIDTHTEYIYNLRKEQILTPWQRDMRSQCKTSRMSIHQMDILADPQGGPY